MSRRSGIPSGSTRPTRWEGAPGPEVDLRGTFLIGEDVIRDIERLLPTFRDADGDHEGMVFLAGREVDEETTLLCTAIAPRCAHSPGSVEADPVAVRDAAREARRRHLAILAQVHSHPAGWTRHSLGDDRLVLMPFEGMLSIVVPHYGLHGMRPISSMGVHQFRDGTWRRVSPGAIRKGVLQIPSSIDLR